MAKRSGIFRLRSFFRLVETYNYAKRFAIWIEGVSYVDEDSLPGGGVGDVGGDDR